MEYVKNYVKEMIEKYNIIIDTDKLEEFDMRMKELIKIKDIYKDKLTILRESTEKEIVRLEYSKGGEGIHRGYYCPSPVLDLIVGNLKRGRLFKRKIPDFGNYTYEYAFDKDNTLLRIRQVTMFTTLNGNFNEEYLIYEGDSIYGLEFNHFGDLHIISKCIYDNGHIIEYQRCPCYSSDMEHLSSSECEEYKYENDMLSDTALYTGISPTVGIFDEYRYLVENDENGKIIRLNGGRVINGRWKKEVITIKPMTK